MSEKHPRFFENYLVEALISYQAIEATLKAYIEFSFRLIKLNLRQDIPFNFNGSDFETAALRTLVKNFSKLSNNSELVKLLNQVSGERDFVAHQAYIHYSADLANEDDHKRRVIEYHERAKSCMESLLVELSELGKRIAEQES